MNSHFLNIVQAAMRATAACPACGRRIVGEDGVRLRGERYHRACAHYSTDRGEARRDS